MTGIEAPDGTLYLPASAIQHRPGYADVTPPLLAQWRRRPADPLVPVTRGELAAGMHVTLPTDVDPTAAAMWPGPSGAEYLYRWADVERIERTTRATRRRRGGKPRRPTPTHPVYTAA